MNKPVKKFILLSLVSVIHIIVLFTLSKESFLNKTFSHVDSKRSVIRLTRVYIKAQKKVSDNGESPKKTKSDVDVSQAAAQVNQLENGSMDEKDLYISSVKRKIEQSKSYPFVAKKLKLEGVVEVEFEIKSSGQIAGLVVTKKVGDKLFIEHTRTLFQTISSFEPLPVNIRENKLQLRLDIVYEI